MRSYFPVDAEHFVFVEQTTELGPRCPTCGQKMGSRMTGQRIALIRGERDNEAGWDVVREKELAEPPIGWDRAEVMAREFARG